MPKFTVEESQLIRASVDSLRTIVRDFKQWEPWSPWLSAEPGVTLTYDEDGKGYAWEGNVIGSGKMRLVDEVENKLTMSLQFIKPWKSYADIEFLFEKQGEETKVTWLMYSSLPFFMFWMKKMMVAWVGADYRRGLAKLKDFAEIGSVPSSLTFTGEGEGVSHVFLGIRDNVPMDKLGEAMQSQYAKLMAHCEENNLTVVAAPFAQYHKWDMIGRSAEYTAAVPLEAMPSEVPDGFVSGKLDAPKTYKITHTGAYRHLGAAWSAGMMLARNKKFTQDKRTDPFEIYVSDPTEVAEGELVTEVHFPAK